MEVSLTLKVIKHLIFLENMVQECHQSKGVEVEHITGIINPSDFYERNEG